MGVETFYLLGASATCLDKTLVSTTPLTHRTDILAYFSISCLDRVVILLLASVYALLSYYTWLVCLSSKRLCYVLEI
jgi:hypothetical protein